MESMEARHKWMMGFLLLGNGFLPSVKKVSDFPFAVTVKRSLLTGRWLQNEPSKAQRTLLIVDSVNL
ncbi:hypothetical protein EHR01_11200 [Leptospira mtsangambouensis]|uniref:Uncharacterized protein n=1 Tax=Leptospira mtsangambouensis TaxID=2484912 RepID=A0ABY2NY58_9LEPT|nr:hypothetical protein EHR01_11200 [Leptospira mtsangambouensis]